MKKKYFVLGGVVLVVALAVWAKLALDARAKREAGILIAKIAPYSDVQYQDIGFNPLTMHTTISDVTITPRNSTESTHVGAIVVKDIDMHSEIPQFMSVQFQDVTADIPQNVDTTAILQKLGYGKKISYDAALEYIYDAPKRELFLKNVSVDAKDIGDIHFELHAGNISFGENQILQLLFSYQSILFYDAKFTYTDKSLVKRSIESAAKESNQDIATFKKNLVAKIREESANQNDPLVKEAVESLIKFTDNPGTLRIVASPKGPKPLGSLLGIQDPTQLFHLLNIHISAS